MKLKKTWNDVKSQRSFSDVEVNMFKMGLSLCGIDKDKEFKESMRSRETQYTRPNSLQSIPNYKTAETISGYSSTIKESYKPPAHVRPSIDRYNFPGLTDKTRHLMNQEFVSRNVPSDKYYDSLNVQDYYVPYNIYTVFSRYSENPVSLVAEYCQRTRPVDFKITRIGEKFTASAVMYFVSNSSFEFESKFSFTSKTKAKEALSYDIARELLYFLKRRTQIHFTL